MAAHPDAGQAAAQYEYMKMQFATSLGHVAQQLRDCAAYADQLSGSVSGVPYNPAAMPLMQFPVPPGGLAAVASPATGKRKTRENEVRSELKKTHPGMPNNELLGMIAKQWSEMSQEDKEKYETLQKAAKDRYLDEKSAYQAGGSPATVVAPVAPPVVVAAPIAVKAVAPTPVVATTSDDDTSEDEEEGSSSDDTSDGSSSPPPKKQKGEQISKEKKKKKPSKA
ncbi:hypothetical protein EVJ58_g5041 [Rhodofomes roseus]|uniref:HMG box domain-containing protein n=1 Tax=Rhodofomes roseus TaxID=34475 RepID=A0A4Y9YEI6_9APHY|nr:hypothetical protein EVJ58_g5041 [Rhodofomes roseus]